MTFCLRLFFLILFVVGARLAPAQENQLPPDQSIKGEVVHGIKYPIAKKYSTHFALQNYYGDRLARTYGLGIQARYSYSEKNWFGFSFSWMSSDVDNQLPKQSDIIVYEPQMIVGPEVGANPIYGKFMLGESLHHFRAGWHLGLAAIQLKKLSPESNSNTWTQGLFGGGQIEMHTSRSWLLSIYSTALLYPADKEFEQTNKNATRVGWQYGIRMGKFF